MPAVTHSESPTLSPTSKKRRRDDDEVQMPLSSVPNNLTTHFNNESQNLLSAIDNSERLISSPNRGPASVAASSPFHNVPRKTIPLPTSKRFRLVNEDEQPSSPTSQSRHGDHPHPHHHQQQRQQSYFSHAHPTPPLSPQVHNASDARPNAASRTNSSAQLLSPCHICHRKPTKKSDLDSFADCMGCGRRTCFVCIRACPGWLSSGAQSTGAETGIDNDLSATTEGDDDEQSTSFTMRDIDDDCNDGHDISHDNQDSSTRHQKGEGGDGGWSGRGHREVICSGCCVERGSEGDVVCLGCLAGIEGA
ncbi:hypothetical protein F5X99DRAFT_189163 [Biscogniauxia marginata]|nr:hypothetical protein F5X99DRAFT_189163 [Biscogniauxia marginata]